MSSKRILRKDALNGPNSYAVSRANLVRRQNKNESVEQSLEKIETNVSDAVTSETVAKIVTLTQQEYDEIAEPDPKTLYIITA